MGYRNRKMKDIEKDKTDPERYRERKTAGY